MSADPLFVDKEAGNFHLRSGSAAIDRGAEGSAPETDIDGNPRPVDVPGVGFDGEGEGFDIGAFEFQNFTNRTGRAWLLYE